MYESPVNVICDEMRTQIEGDVFKAIQNVGINVDKDKLIKALQYDRQQYEKGYADGYAKGIDEFAERLKAEFPMVEDEYGATANLILNKKIDEIAEGMRGAT